MVLFLYVHVLCTTSQIVTGVLVAYMQCPQRQSSYVDSGKARSIVVFIMCLEIIMYTPPTRLNCRVESRRRCVHYSQLVGDLDESEQICQRRTELRRVGGVNAPNGSRDPVYYFLCF